MLLWINNLRYFTCELVLWPLSWQCRLCFGIGFKNGKNQGLYILHLRQWQLHWKASSHAQVFKTRVAIAISKYCPNLILILTRALFGIPLVVKSWARQDDIFWSWNLNKTNIKACIVINIFKSIRSLSYTYKNWKKYWQTQGFLYDEGGSSYTCPFASDDCPANA